MAIHNRIVVQIGDKLRTAANEPTHWTVVGIVYGGVGTRAYASCQCTCGAIVPVRISAVLAGKSFGCKNCGQTDRRKWPIAGTELAGHRILSVSVTNQGVMVHTECIRCGCKVWKTLDAVQEAARRGTNSSCKHCLPWRQIKPDMLGRFIQSHYRKKWPTLPMQAIRAIFSSNCFYCGGAPANVLRSHWVAVPNTSILYQGIDEVVHGEGHVLGNVLPCCIVCNKAKNNHPLAVFCLWYNRRRPEEHQLTPDQIIAAAKQLGLELQNLKEETPNAHRKNHQ